MTFKIKDGVRIGTVDVLNNAGESLNVKVRDPGTAFSSALTPTTLTADRVLTLPDATGTVALTSQITTVNDGTLSLSMGAAGATNTTVTVGTGTGFSANTATNAAYSLSVGPAVTALASQMTGAGSGFLKKSGADTYTLDTNTYLTAEADTLATVTGRGSTTTTAISTTNATASTTTGTGALVVTGGVGIGGALNVGGAGTFGGNVAVNGGSLTTNLASANLFNSSATTVNIAGAGTTVSIGAATGNTTVNNNLTVTGNLTVNGTTTTVNSTTMTVDDVMLVLGGDTAPAADDNLDKGIEFRWHNGTAAKLGFFGYQDSSGTLTYIPDATDTAGVISGAIGTLNANIPYANVTGAPAVNNGTLTLNIGAAGATNTTVGVSTGTGYSANTATNTTYSLAIGPALTNLATAMTGATTGFLKKTAADTYTLDTATYLTAETDTLQTVTTRGATSNVALSLTNATDSTTPATGALKLSGGLGVAKNVSVGVDLNHAAAGVVVAADRAVTATVATVATTAVDTWALATYRSAKYLVQITQGTNYQVSEIMVMHNGTTTVMTEYGVLESNGALGTFTSAINGANVELRVTMGTATSATIKMTRQLLVV